MFSLSVSASVSVSVSVSVRVWLGLCVRNDPANEGAKGVESLIVVILDSVRVSVSVRVGVRVRVRVRYRNDFEARKG